MRWDNMLVACIVLGFLIAGVKAAEDTKPVELDKSFKSDFAVDKANLAATGRNPYFVLEPGFVIVLEGGSEKVTITVKDETKKVDGVECRVVEEHETKDGKVTEISNNYFAIDKQTNDLYYFGEDAGGAWLSGEKGARFGLMLPGKPTDKDKYYQEIAPGVALDRAEHKSLTETVKTPAGEFKDCLKVEETTQLEPGKGYKVYAPGVGLIQDGKLKVVKYGKAEDVKK